MCEMGCGKVADADLSHGDAGGLADKGSHYGSTSVEYKAKET